MEVKFVILSAIAVAIVHFSNAADYCDISSCKVKSEHTLCKFSGISSNCYANGDLGGGITSEDKKNIVNLHNKLRQKVARGDESRGMPGPQPAAKSIPNLSWDDELAKIAQTWADQCDYNHDNCRNVERFRVGQNIAFSGTTGDISTVKITDMVQGWYDEVQYFDKSQVSNFQSGKASNGEDVGHYTQMVWAKTTKIGCGQRNYNDGTFNNKYLVCNYGPTGNIRDTPIYEKA